MLKLSNEVNEVNKVNKVNEVPKYLLCTGAVLGDGPTHIASVFIIVFNIHVEKFVNDQTF